MKKIPMRRCVVSNQQFPKKELIRIVKTPEGNVEIDSTGKLNGRGAYLKLDRDIVEKARKTKVLEKHLEVKVDDQIYDQLLEMIK